MLLFRKLGELAVRSLVKYYLDTPQPLNSQSNQPQQSKFSFITILGRKHYDERHIVLPVTEKKDVEKILNLKYRNDYDVYDIKKQNENSSIITLWRFLDRDNLNSGFIIPETKLLEITTPKDTALEINTGNNSGYFFIKTPITTKSTLKTALISNIETFAQASGVTLNNSLKFDINDLRSHLNKAITQIKPNNLVQFYWKKLQNSSQTFKLAWLAPSLSLATAYLVLTSAYLLLKEQSLLSEIDALSKESQTIMAQKQAIDKNIETIDALQKLNDGNVNTTNIWMILHPLYEYGVKFTSIRVNKNTVYVSGTVKQAINVLELLNNNTQVKNAKFNGALFNTDRGERFNVEFNYE